jgi:hypothetical protein
MVCPNPIVKPLEWGHDNAIAQFVRPHGQGNHEPLRHLLLKVAPTRSSHAESRGCAGVKPLSVVLGSGGAIYVAPVSGDVNNLNQPVSQALRARSTLRVSEGSGRIV